MMYCVSPDRVRAAVWHSDAIASEVHYAGNVPETRYRITELQKRISTALLTPRVTSGALHSQLGEDSKKNDFKIQVT
jgi:hypothetical protein